MLALHVRKREWVTWVFMYRTNMTGRFTFLSIWHVWIICTRTWHAPYTRLFHNDKGANRFLSHHFRADSQNNHERHLMKTQFSAIWIQASLKPLHVSVLSPNQLVLINEKILCLCVSSAYLISLLSITSFQSCAAFKVSLLLIPPLSSYSL